MADGDALVNLDDSHAVSTRSDSFSPPPDGGSPPTMISDCSDLLDLINFHASNTVTTTTTTTSSSSTSSTTKSARKHKDHSGSSSSGSSSPSHSSDSGSDSDSGSYATGTNGTNGRSHHHHHHNRRRTTKKSGDAVIIQHPVPASPESALASSPATTIPSSVEALSPVAGNEIDHSRLLDLELSNDHDNTHHQMSSTTFEETHHIQQHQESVSFSQQVSAVTTEVVRTFTTTTLVGSTAEPEIFTERVVNLGQVDDLEASGHQQNSSSESSSSSSHVVESRSVESVVMVQKHHQQEERMVVVTGSHETLTAVGGEGWTQTEQQQQLVDFSGGDGDATAEGDDADQSTVECGTTYTTTTTVIASSTTLVQSESPGEWTITPEPIVQSEVVTSVPSVETSIQQSEVVLTASTGDVGAVDLEEVDEVEPEDDFPSSAIVDDDESASADIPVASAADQSDSSSSDEEDHLRDDDEVAGTILPQYVQELGIVQQHQEEAVIIAHHEEPCVESELIEQINAAESEVQLDGQTHILQVDAIPEVEITEPEIELVQTEILHETREIIQSEESDKQEVEQDVQVAVVEQQQVHERIECDVESEVERPSDRKEVRFQVDVELVETERLVSDVDVNAVQQIDEQEVVAVEPEIVAIEPEVVAVAEPEIIDIEPEIVAAEPEVVVEEEIQSEVKFLHVEPELHVQPPSSSSESDSDAETDDHPQAPQRRDDEIVVTEVDEREPTTASTDLPERMEAEEDRPQESEDVSVVPEAQPEVAPLPSPSPPIEVRPASPLHDAGIDAPVELHDTSSSSSDGGASDSDDDHKQQQKRRTTTSSTTISSSSTSSKQLQQQQQQLQQQQVQQQQKIVSSSKKVVQQTEQQTSSSTAGGKHVTSISTTLSTSSKVNSEVKLENGGHVKPVAASTPTNVSKQQVDSEVHTSVVMSPVSMLSAPRSGHSDSSSDDDVRDCGEQPLTIVEELTVFHGGESNGIDAHEFDNAPSVASLKTTYITQITEPRECEKHEKETVLTGISIKQLKASFSEPSHHSHQPHTLQTSQIHLVQNGDDVVDKTQKFREVIDITGVDIKSLKSSYTDLSRIEDSEQKSRAHVSRSKSFASRCQRARSYGDLSKLDMSQCFEDETDDAPIPLVLMRAKSYSDLSRYEEERKREKEVIYTGVSVKALRLSFCDVSRDDHYSVNGSAGRTTNGKLVGSLKSSFSSSDSVQQQHQEFNDAEGVKIDRNKITRNFSQADCPLYALLDANEFTSVADEKSAVCRICGKQVFHMERIKAEKSVFHKGCFRCQECSKPLSVDTYCSHEGVLYCRSHFRLLFQPKAKFEEEAISFPRRKHEMIIKENTPAELPPDVVRSADKPDYGLTEIPSLKNIKSRFESTDYDETDQAQLSTPVRRSESIITKMAKFQGLQSPENGNGQDEDSSSSDDEHERDPEIIRESKHKKEKTTFTQVAKSQDEVVTYSGMSELKSQWETGSVSTKEERARERQEELAKLRLRICQSKGNLKAKYESACEESSILKSPSHLTGEEIHSNGEARTSSIKERFEKGDVINDVELEKAERVMREKEEDLSVFKEQGSSNDARTLFKQIDATTSKTSPVMNSSVYSNGGILRSPSMRTKEVLYQSTTVTDGEIVRAADKIDDDVLAPVDLTSRFKFFQNFNDSQNQQERKRFTITPPRDDVAPKESSPEPLAPRDPSVVRGGDNVGDDLPVTDTARKMLNKFRELEYQAERGEETPAGPKPLKRITPPREFTREGEGSPEPEAPRNPDIVRACDKVEDDFLIEAHKAKSLKAKFEHWPDDENEVERENRRNAADELQPNAETAKNLKAKFEALKECDRSLLDNKPKPKVNRFIDLGGGANGELCDICGNRVYSMEKLEVNNHKVHKTCFRCSHCQTILRMDNYTTSEGVLFCTNHFKQLFIAKGNYDEGFGREQHKERWNKNSRSSTPNSALCETQYGNSDYSDE